MIRLHRESLQGDEITVRKNARKDFCNKIGPKLTCQSR